MLEVLQFIFSGFWVWVGTVILIFVIGEGVARVVSAIRSPRCIDCDE
jgi:hypothetical protein